MLVLKTNFYFLGERPYVHGPTILGCFLNTLKEFKDGTDEEADAEIVTCRFRQFISENGTVLCWTSQEKRPKFQPEHLCATATVRSRQGTCSFILLKEGTQPISRRVPYGEDKYLGEVVSDDQFGGKGFLREISTKKDFIRAVVAFNKRVHIEAERKTGRLPYRWIFSSLEELILPGLPTEIAKNDLRAEARLELANINLWNMGGNLQSISEGYVEFRHHEPCKFKIGFTGVRE